MSQAEVPQGPSGDGLELSSRALEEMRGQLSRVADDVVAAIVEGSEGLRDGRDLGLLTRKPIEDFQR